MRVVNMTEEGGNSKCSGAWTGIITCARRQDLTVKRSNAFPDARGTLATSSALFFITRLSQLTEND